MEFLGGLSGRELGVSQATIATLSTAIMIGLGFISRPTKAALLWSLAFAVATLCTFGTIVGEVIGSDTLRTISLGVMMAAPTLIWSGMRAHRGRASFAWIALAQAVVGGAAMALLDDTVWFSVVFRVIFLAGAVFAGLTVWEIRRIPERNDRMLLPLVFVSAAFVPLGFVTALAGILYPPTLGDDLTLVRAVNSLGMLIYLVCALVSLVALTLATDPTRGGGSWGAFTVTVRDRLERAEAADERSWSLVEFRLDDLATIREAGGLTSFATIISRFQDAIRGSFPAEADVAADRAGRVFVFVARPSASVRISIRAALDKVSRVDRDDPLAVQLYASAGWATVEATGYDWDALTAATGAAVDDAERTGGDRWRAAASTPG